MTEQKWTKQQIRSKMEANTVEGDAWVVKGMLAILNYQTPDEKVYGQTVEDNGVGFNGVDAQILTSFCDQASRKLESMSNDKYKYSKCLSQPQMDIARKKMLKYAGQLARIANSKSVASD